MNISLHLETSVSALKIDLVLQIFLRFLCCQTNKWIPRTGRTTDEQRRFSCAFLGIFLKGPINTSEQLCHPWKFNFTTRQNAKGPTKSLYSKTTLLLKRVCLLKLYIAWFHQSRSHALQRHKGHSVPMLAKLNIQAPKRHNAEGPSFCAPEGGCQLNEQGEWASQQNERHYKVDLDAVPKRLRGTCESSSIRFKQDKSWCVRQG